MSAVFPFASTEVETDPEAAGVAGLDCIASVGVVGAVGGADAVGAVGVVGALLLLVLHAGTVENSPHEAATAMSRDV